MPSYNLAIIGMGNVARALLRLLISKETDLRRRYDIRWRLTGVATRRIGWIADPDGLNPLAVLNGHPIAPRGNISPPSNVREWLEKRAPTSSLRRVRSTCKPVSRLPTT